MKINVKTIRKSIFGPIVLTDFENDLLEITKQMLAREDRTIEINPDDMSYLVHSAEWDYYLIVNSIEIEFSNHTHSDCRQYREDFLDLIKETIKEVTIKDRLAKLAKVRENKKQLYGRIKENLNKPVSKEFMKYERN